MIKKILISFVLIFLSILAGTTLIHDAGYVLVIVRGWQMQCSLVVAVSLLLILLIVLYLVYDLGAWLISLPGRVQKLWEQRRKACIQAGLEAYYQNNWSQALKKFTPNAASWVIDLIAAQAAQNIGDIAQRNKFLHLAACNKPSAQKTILMFQANLQYEQGQYEEAQATLNNLATFFSLLPLEWYWLQAKLYLHFKAFSNGIMLLSNNPKLRHQQQAYYDFYKKFVIGLLQDHVINKQYELIDKLLTAIPAPLKDDIDILATHACAMLQQPEYCKGIRKLIARALNKATDIIACLTLIANLPPEQCWLVYIEKRPTIADATYYLLVGKIKAKHSLWGAAIADLHKSLSIKKTAQAYALLANIYLEIKQVSNALEAMQHAIACV